jgi:hypothetical protein
MIPNEAAPAIVGIIVIIWTQVAARQIAGRWSWQKRR